jgi:bisphosphoglycerate-dependent phosphoglycerate mutase
MVLTFYVIYTLELIKLIHYTNIVVNQLCLPEIPILKRWELNEKYIRTLQVIIALMKGVSNKELDTKC